MKASRVLSALLCMVVSWSVFAASTEFTYQGQMRESNAPSNGSYDFTFSLHDAAAGGTQIGTLNTRPNQAVVNGVFTVLLDFGNSAFNGNDRYLEISVRKASVGSLTALTPRQKIPAAPQAVAFTGALAGDVVGGQVGTSVVSVGGVLAAQVASGATAANNATSSATPGRIVIRDGNGNFKSASPTDPDHAATKSYVDNAASASNAAVAGETARALAAEAAQTANLAAEIARAQAMEEMLLNSISDEIAARMAGDSALQAALDAETAARQSAESALQNSISGKVNRNGGDTMTGAFTMSSGANATLPLKVSGAGAGQTANLQEWWNGGIVPKATLDANGDFAAAGFSGNGANVTNVNAASLNGLNSSAFMPSSGADGTTILGDGTPGNKLRLNLAQANVWTASQTMPALNFVGPVVPDQSAAPGGIASNFAQIFGQSFTAGVTGNLVRFDMEHGTDAPTGTVRVYQGTAASGSIIYEALSVPLTGGLQSFTFNTPVALTAGQVYTFAIFNAGGASHLFSFTNVYVGGGIQSEFGGFAFDTKFTSYMQGPATLSVPTGSDAAGAPGQIRYNAATNKFQGYVGGGAPGWVDLH